MDNIRVVGFPPPSFDQQQDDQERPEVRKRVTQLEMEKLIGNPLYLKHTPSSGDNEEDGTDPDQTQNQITNAVDRVQEGQDPAQNVQTSDAHSADISRLDTSKNIPDSAASLNDVGLDKIRVCIIFKF